MAFNALINSIAPIETPSDWVRPLDWPIITDVSGEVQFLVADTGEKCFSIATEFTRTTGDIYIDWGDGTIDTITTTSTTITSHTYSTIGTPCSRGYSTFKVRVYGDLSTTIVSCYNIAPIALNSSIYYNIGLLEVYYGDGCCDTNSVFPNYTYSSNGGFGSKQSFSYLEYIKFPSSVSYTNNLSYLFLNCINLYKVVMPTSMPSITVMTSTFQGCTNLRECILPSDMFGINGDFSSIFSECTNLKNVVLPPTLNLAISMSNLFSGCKSLKNLIIPSINSCNSFNTMFDGCQSLQWVKFTSLPTVVSVNMASMFSSCYNLQNVYFPNSCLSTTVFTANSLFSNCYNLKNVNFPTNFNASNLISSFSNCYKLTGVVFNSPMPNLISFGSTFNSCFNLKTVVLPSTVGTNITLTNMFNNCYSLESMTIPSAWNLTAVDSTFNNCFNIKTIVLPNNTQNSITNMTSAFAFCSKLKNLTLPTSLTGVIALSSAFNGCTSLINISLPSTMNSCTAMTNTFLNCYSLEQVTLPTSMSACTIFTSSFNSCYNIESITFPATVPATVTTYASAFNKCFSLKTITFPTVQQTSLNSLDRAFGNCGALTTLNNLDKLGSLSATPLVLTSGNGSTTLIPSLSFNCPFSKVQFAGTLVSLNKLNSIRLLNTSAGQYTSSAPQVDFSYCDLGIAALDQLFTDLPILTGKTINITGCTGSAGCNRTIATAKGWTVTG